jgi:UDP-glucuronate 4-epimerase
MKILVTGAAGFIGMHTCQRLLDRGDEVVGIDNLNEYYDVRLKEARLRQLRQSSKFTFEKVEIADSNAVGHFFARHAPQRVVHLAAQAGVRYSLTNPQAYVQSNLLGFTNILEACRHSSLEHLVYASSSSVYGGNAKLPFSEHDNVGHPLSMYAATKKANELMAHTYSHLFGLPTTGLRFFTVYGPWGRPDMALFIFTKSVLEGTPISVFNHGNMVRDFTYIDDIVEGLLRLLDKPAEANPAFDATNPDPASSNAPYRIFNIGNGQPIRLMNYIEAIEAATGKVAVLSFLPFQPGDVQATAANVDELNRWVGYRPNTDITAGVAKFVDWYLKYHADIKNDGT